MKILKATKYQDRTVIQVCFNPDDPKWKHVIGDPFVDSNGERVFDGGVEVKVTDTHVTPEETGYSDEAKEPGRILCYNCRINWIVKDYPWDGNEQYKTVDGESVLKTADDLEQELIQRIEAEQEAAIISSLLNKDLTLSG